MKTFIALIFSLFITSFAFSQSIGKTSDVAKSKSAVTKTFVLNTAKFSPSVVTDLSNELLGWDTKVISSVIDSVANTLTVTHNEFFIDVELVEVLNKYGMSDEYIVSYF